MLTVTRHTLSSVAGCDTLPAVMKSLYIQSHSSDMLSSFSIDIVHRYTMSMRPFIHLDFEVSIRISTIDEHISFSSEVPSR